MRCGGNLFRKQIFTQITIKITKITIHMTKSCFSLAVNKCKSKYDDLICDYV